jgi:hypothetical protein
MSVSVRSHGSFGRILVLASVAVDRLFVVAAVVDQRNTDHRKTGVGRRPQRVPRKNAQTPGIRRD